MARWIVPSLAVLSLLSFIAVAAAAAAAEEQSCAANDETCATANDDDVDCVDSVPECTYWAGLGECEQNSVYMLQNCAKSCNACGGKDGKTTPDPEEWKKYPQDDYGVIQTVDENHKKEMDHILDGMKNYFKTKRADPELPKKMHELLDNCLLKHPSCAFWAVLGECTANPKYMQRECAPVCQSCDQLSVDYRCPLDPNAQDAWQEGDLNRFFTNITTLPEFTAIYTPTVLSRPDVAPGDEDSNKDELEYKVGGPWVVLLDNFVSDEEADRLIELGAVEGYARSADVGKMKFDGTFDSNVNQGRTSENAWCQNQCMEDPMALNVVDKISKLTYTPHNNSEYLQLLRYDVGQHYQKHHDYIGFQRDRQVGVRILTIFLYLNTVEDDCGGGTDFPKLGITVQPKKGRALIWPSVLDADPNAIDIRTDHQALPVLKGQKYGANAWIHQRNFKGPSEEGCQ